MGEPEPEPEPDWLPKVPRYHSIRHNDASVIMEAIHRTAIHSSREAGRRRQSLCQHLTADQKPESLGDSRVTQAHFNSQHPTVSFTDLSIFPLRGGQRQRTREAEPSPSPSPSKDAIASRAAVLALADVLRIDLELGPAAPLSCPKEK
ncbi:hypothetical protein M5D96_000847 [Drosophila gunungcola]|uniref:Uncharacterized protein n=1 Tax=Drosophila gunungcola TaxID=103775 RepID=A0A9Q0BUH5_9MUSC|nr:hypothetical protein M5D96_000847 [Drosophila gunungcola]